ncbi:ArsR/SmtB family transcription factor [Aestuariibius sp. 2305UL40-4]|uniref:ArsR/SmtB family transcription factor n=1 Tax=Aestuariibius violaceus TaxID=3234132 RepID=UPI00345E70B8
MDAPTELLRSLADPTRRGIFEDLCLNGDKTVRALTDKAGISQPAVSKHLAILKQAGLVDGTPTGRQTRYRARPKALAPLVDWTHRMTAFWDGRLDALEDTLKRIDQ